MKNTLPWMLSLAAGLLLPVSSLAAVDVSGTWTGTMRQKSDDGQERKAAIVFHLKQQGSQVSGTAGPAEEEPEAIHDAKLEGDRLTFTVGGGSKQSWKFELKVSKYSLKGTGEGTSASGESLGTTEVSMSRRN